MRLCGRRKAQNLLASSRQRLRRPYCDKDPAWLLERRQEPKPARFLQNGVGRVYNQNGYEDVEGVYHRGEAGVGFFVACGDAAKRLYPAKVILDQMTPFIFLSVVAVGAFGSLSRRDDRLGDVTREELSLFVGVESFVTEKRAASYAVHELVDEIDVVTLAGNQGEGDEISQGVDECADLCRQSAT